LKATTNARPEFALLSDSAELKPKKFRDRKTHEQRTKEKLKTEDRAHPVREPYRRPRTRWDSLLVQEEDDD
jgi:hypothetical protein